jgi:hypothetical protein
MPVHVNDKYPGPLAHQKLLWDKANKGKPLWTLKQVRADCPCGSLRCYYFANPQGFRLHIPVHKFWGGECGL